MAQLITFDLWKYPSPTELLEKSHSYHRNGTIRSLLLVVGERNSLVNLTTEPKSVGDVTTVPATHSFTDQNSL
jgi:hypothetical protein